MEKINYQEERYDALNKKLSDVEVLKEDKEVTERLVKEMRIRMELSAISRMNLIRQAARLQD